ncbi:myosin II light chain [Marasmius crinis-equi]|uniref:Myosin II light chain n=1 Tax=Marasmius crinis-equi TaxID=585013 RepID=A0ABR3FJZ7_9AGAR
MSDNAEYKEAFALFDKKGTGAVPRETLGDLLRALGQNPTQAEVQEIVNAAPRDVDYKTFLTILNRPDGFKPAGTPGKSTHKSRSDNHFSSLDIAEEFIRGFQVFDKEGNGFIGAGELRYVLTQLGEKMSDEEVDELLKGVQVGPDGNVNYESFVRTILSQ